MNAAEELREAARLMRARAEAATPGKWVHDSKGAVRSPSLPSPRSGGWVTKFGGCVVNRPSVSLDPERTEPNAEHIASWHPAVALAVADWLDYQARAMEVNVEEGARSPGCHPTHPAIALARAYLKAAS